MFQGQITTNPDGICADLMAAADDLTAVWQGFNRATGH
jgi:hypothetical protein